MKILHVLPTGMGVVAILLSLTTAWEALSVYEKSKELLGSDYWKQYSDFMKMATELPDATQKMGSFLVDRAKEELSAKEAELQTLLKTFYASEERMLKEFGVEKGYRKLKKRNSSGSVTSGKLKKMRHQRKKRIISLNSTRRNSKGCSVERLGTTLARHAHGLRVEPQAQGLAELNFLRLLAR